MGKRNHYSDQFRASAIATLVAADYPDRKGSLNFVAKQLDVPAPTLHRWFNGENNPVSSELVNEKKRELSVELEEVAYALVKSMLGKIPDATLQQTATSLGIVIDKMQLLKGAPTWRGEIINLLKDGTITPQDVLNEFSDAPELAKELFESAGLRFAGIGEITAETVSESMAS